MRWQGSYHRVETTWLRWASLEGELLPTEEEVARQAQQQAQQERQRAELLAERLRQAGIDPDSVA